MFWDTHLHSYFSGDSEAYPAAIAESAIEKGLAGICFTDHQDFDYRENPRYFDLDVDRYYKEIMALKETYASRLPILWGIELGLQPHVSEANLALVQNHPFDFVIGSTHIVDHIDVYYPSYYEGKTEEEVCHRYFASILENLDTNVDFDVYGHIDYIVRFLPSKRSTLPLGEYADEIDQILRTLIERGKGIELNMAGYKYGLGHPNPTEDILKRYRELGGEIITLGSDGHTPAQIGWDYAKIPGLLQDAGFSYYTVFKNRRPEFIKL